MKYTDIKMQVGIIDADLLDNGTRHPNLVLMQIAGYLRERKIKYELIYNNNADINTFSYIFISKVFTFTKEPEILQEYRNKNNIFRGGTGYYAEETDNEKFNKLREFDLSSLANNKILPNFSISKQKPDYNLYDKFIEYEISRGKSSSRFKDYQKFSIGFLTRGCVRKCPFCVNKNIDYVYDYSKLEDFTDNQRPRIYLWDDNFLASKNWKEHLLKLQETKKPFQFRQGLDIRLMTDEKAELLSKSKYYGDYIFAFDQIKDMFLIEKKLKIWKSYSNKTTKLYLFCGYQISDDQSIIDDVINLFKRIEILMKYACLGYVMRHENYKNHRLNNIYTQIARWCNQPQFYKKMSFKEFIDRNQYWTKTDRKCMSLKSYEEFLDHFKSHQTELEYYFNMKYINLVKFK